MIPKALLVVITVLLLATPASAATIVWDFATLATAGEHPTPFPFTSGGFTLIATGSSPNHPTPPFLAPSGPLAQPATPIFVKNGGGDENGLGVCLSTGNWVQVTKSMHRSPRETSYASTGIPYR